ncbi:MAG: ATP-binding protein [Thermoprotei archaeon]|nr:MAG: ATP-binding protein [Thermoprotei archaeon]
MKFINREIELKVLEEACRSGKAELVIIYGRRRIGKTTLLSVFAKHRNAIYLIVNFDEREPALRDLTSQFLGQVKLPYTPLIQSFSDLYLLFNQVNASIIIIDEFQRLHNTGGVTELQHIWDRHLSKGHKIIILCGSSVGMMERIGLSYESPLYGRATRVLKIKELDYGAARSFVEKYGEEDKVRTYAVFGGTPGYLALIDDEKSLLQNIKNLILDPGATLREEPLTLLSMELREPTRYIQVLEAIAQGATKLGEIASKTGFKTSDIAKYIRILEKELDLIERKYPILEEGKRGKARYYLKNNFFKFWFSYIFPHINLLEFGLQDRVLDIIERNIDIYTSKVFEDIALQHFISLSHEGAFEFTKIGKWWQKDIEIDIVAIDEKKLNTYFIEVKWTKKPVDKRELYKLISKAQEFPWMRDRRRETYVMYSKAGYTFEKEENIYTFTLKDIQTHFSKNKPKIKVIN